MHVHASTLARAYLEMGAPLEQVSFQLWSAHHLTLGVAKSTPLTGLPIFMYVGAVLGLDSIEWARSISEDRTPFGV